MLHGSPSSFGPVTPRTTSTHPSSGGAQRGYYPPVGGFCQPAGPPNRNKRYIKWVHDGTPVNAPKVDVHPACASEPRWRKRWRALGRTQPKGIRVSTRADPETKSRWQHLNAANMGWRPSDRKFRSRCVIIKAIIVFHAHHRRTTAPRL